MSKIEYSTFGRHVLIEATGIDCDIAEDIEKIKQFAVESIQIGEAGLLSIQEHRAEDKISLLFLLSESHFSIYIKPDKRYISLDCYTCGERVDPNKIVDHFLSYLTPKITHRMNLMRGIGRIEVE